MQGARERESGAVLVLALMLVIALGSMTTVVVQRSRTLARETMASRAAHEVRCAVDAGVALARYRLAADPSYRQGATSVGRCVVDVIVQPGAPDRWTVEIRARRNPGDGLPHVARKTIVLERGQGLPIVR